jgi:hypothetical protein
MHKPGNLYLKLLRQLPELIYASCLGVKFVASAEGFM